MKKGIPTNRARGAGSWILAALAFDLILILVLQHLPKVLLWPARIAFFSVAAFLAWMLVRAARRTHFGGKTVLFSGVLLVLMYLAIHGLCSVFVHFMSRRDERFTDTRILSLDAGRQSQVRALLAGTGLELYDRDIGWVPRPGFWSDRYTINRQGIRALREYPMTPPDPDRRILCLGDSYTFGFSVGDTESYPSHGERILPGTEWINLGISGSCLTQSYLHYRKSGKGFGGKYVIIGFMTNDAIRTVNCFRAFVSPGDPFTKPFAKYAGGRFTIEPNPFQDINDYRKLLEGHRRTFEHLWELDYLNWSNQRDVTHPVLMTGQYASELLGLEASGKALLNLPVSRSAKPKQVVKPYGNAIWNPESPGFRALTSLFDQYHGEVVSDGRIPLIVIIPGPRDVDNYSKGKPRAYQTLLEFLRARDYRFFDFLDSLEASRGGTLDIDELYFNFHFRGHVNRELAQEIIKTLEW
jgi:hypothetical protein